MALTLLERTVTSCAIKFVRWSHYGPQFIEPVVNKARLEKMYDDGSAKERAFFPIKAARNYENNSLFYDPLFVKFTNIMMKEGNRQLARQLLEKTFENIKRIQLEKYHKADETEKMNIECNPFKILHQAVENCKPVMQLTPMKKGGATYQVPTSISEKRARFRAIKWILRAADERNKSDIRLPEQLAWELVNAAQNEGKAMKRKQDLYQQCETNRAYAHYRWA